MWYVKIPRVLKPQLFLARRGLYLNACTEVYIGNVGKAFGLNEAPTDCHDGQDFNSATFIAR